LLLFCGKVISGSKYVYSYIIGLNSYLQEIQVEFRQYIGKHVSP